MWLQALGASKESDSYVRKGTFQVHEWMGASRTQSNEDLLKYDVVITTYETYRSNQKGLGIGGAAGRVLWSRVVLDEVSFSVGIVSTHSFVLLKTQHASFCGIEENKERTGELLTWFQPFQTLPQTRVFYHVRSLRTSKQDGDARPRGQN